MNTVTVELCMGSSCFARGNAKALEHLEAFIESNKLTDRIDLSGHLCLGNCSEGPNVKIDGILHQHIHPESVVPLVRQALEAREVSDGKR